MGRRATRIRLLQTLGLAFGLGMGAWRALAQSQPPPQFLPIEARWCLESGRCIALEVADQPDEQAKGLQLRSPQFLQILGDSKRIMAVGSLAVGDLSPSIEGAMEGIFPLTLQRLEAELTL